MDIRIANGLTVAGFTPADALPLHLADRNAEPKTIKVVRYFAERGWDAARVDGADVLVFARADEEGFRLLITNGNGAVSATAQFSPDTIGARLFLAAAMVRP
jgi:hypothetical protein